jgi:transglutaminase-like putative cysteine protease
MRYTVSHVTRYHYEEPVVQCVSEARLVPRNLPYQNVHGHWITVQPEPASIEERIDYFGNTVTAFTVFHRHDSLTVRAEGIIEVDRPRVTLPGVAWEDVRADFESGKEPLVEASEFLHDSPYVGVSADLASYGLPSFTSGQSLSAAVLDLSSRIHSDFEYQPKATSIDMPLGEVFHLRRGVCQDFAHVMIGVLRSLHLPARYVSGYLRSGDVFQGAEASHAWVATFIPGFGWLDIDPTNNVIPSNGHVTVAWGRDYGDVTPVKGISLGGGRQSVEVEVAVRPAG